MFRALSPGTADVGDHHLDVAVAAQVAPVLDLADAPHGRVTKVDCLNRIVLGAQPAQDLDDTTCFSSRRCIVVLKLHPELSGRALFVSVWAKLGFLPVLHQLSDISKEQTSSRRLYWGGLHGIEQSNLRKKEGFSNPLQRRKSKNDE